MVSKIARCVRAAVVECRGLKGVVVALDELGHVTCSYMGTDPSHLTPPTPQAREMDYEVSRVESFDKSLDDVTYRN